jgi:hypothetical protein
MATKTRSRSERESKPRPKSDAYTGLLIISLLAMITSCVLWYVDYDSYGKAAPQMPKVPAPGSSTGVPIPTAPPASETPATPPSETPAPMPMDTPMPMETPMPMPPKGDLPMPPKGDMPMPPKGQNPPAPAPVPKGM